MTQIRQIEKAIANLPRENARSSSNSSGVCARARPTIAAGQAPLIVEWRRFITSRCFEEIVEVHG